MAFQRAVLQDIIERVSEPRKFIQVLVGPRQVGKTTLIRQLLEKTSIAHHFVTADDLYVADNTWIRREWSNARLQLQQTGSKEILFIIDEVQKVPNWSEAIKKEWDADSFSDTAVKVILLGSSRLLIQKGLTESLAGRYELMNITHWSFDEMRDAFGWSLDQYIYFGGYPGSASLIGNEERWKDYIRESLVETTLSKDILMMTRVDKPILLKRLFDIGCKYSSQILSLTKVQGELQESGNLTTLSGYLTLLKEAGLLSGLEKYAADIIRKRASKPKFQVHNNALLAAGQNVSFETLRNDHKEWGRFAESAVGAHLINSGLKHRFKVYYWNEGGFEVDYVIEKGEDIIALEVKSGKESVNKGISLFDEVFHPRGIYLVGTDGIPFEKFLSMNPAELFQL
ncbi:MAG: ATP-binding protein [Candidatus Symbiothrix sp.]|jgi:predicted AAA+ superfamily ATPase|nr:ATP-binding protein [Candidatus Symbiothrix sp.]